QPIQLLGIDPFVDAPFRDYLVNEAGSNGGDLLPLLTQPGAILLSSGAADRFGLVIGDVLTLETERMLLITGMANLQTIRTAEMADIHWILLVRNKKATQEMLKLANELGIVMIETAMSSFRTCGILYNAGLKPVY
ncbi:MAG TPA: hypothetical protein PLB87_12035, partial [Prolixibacteraceae bacterium]|nr:hypothetical protein [Prolixibacteraceae bacterium]